MNAPFHPGDAGQIDPTAQVSGRWRLKGIQTACVSGIVAANVYGWSMTVTGFKNTQLLPSNDVFGTVVVPVLVSTILQLCILAFYLSIPYFHKQKMLAAVTAYIFGTCLIGLGALFGLYSITLNAASDNITTYSADQLLDQKERLVTIDNRMSSVFNSYLGNLDILGRAACQGSERARNQRCSRITRSYFALENRLRTKYAAEIDTPAFADSPRQLDIFQGWNRMKLNVGLVAAKLAPYSAFARDTGVSTVGVLKDYKTVKADVEAFGHKFHDEAPDARSLVLARVFGEVDEIVHMRAQPSSYLAAFIAFLPDVLSLTFTALLVNAYSASARAPALRRAIGTAEQDTSLYIKLTEAWSNLAKAKNRWAAIRRHSNMADAVDKSVPDA